MFLKMAKLGTYFAAAALTTVALLGDARAANLNTSAAAFRAYDGSQEGDIQHGITGTMNSASSERIVTGAVVRSPVDGSSGQSFYIDGWNASGHSTYFTLASFDYQGNIQCSISFVGGEGTYDIFQTLDPVGTWDYVTLAATLPADYNGSLTGVTALQ
jgi:hypothetical protein